ncbi:MAG: hypothetical protein M1472_05200 [Planctomycetes bacterium]|nr:hypothetical protein [Planctomycetota bacterium]MDA8375575.1 hypothetical protein [Planctomycetia bacterium]
MATLLLQNQSWDVGQVGGQCAGCSVELPPGAPCWATLVEVRSVPQPSGEVKTSAGAWQRLNFCPECWRGGKRPAAPAEMFSFWKTIVPESPKKPKVFVDDSVLLDLFNRLADREEIMDLRFRFVLALLLMRKRLLKYEGTSAMPEILRDKFGNLTPLPEVWNMIQRGGGAVVVLNPHLSAEQIGEVSQQLSSILAEEI